MRWLSAACSPLSGAEAGRSCLPLVPNAAPSRMQTTPGGAHLWGVGLTQRRAKPGPFPGPQAGKSVGSPWAL